MKEPVIQMRNIEDQLRIKGEGFRRSMDDQCEQRFPLVIQYLSEAFHCEDDLKGDTEESKKLLLFLKRLWQLGYYSGINFALDPDVAFLTEMDDGLDF